MFRLEINHPGLHKYRVIRGETRDIVNLRAELQMRAWNEQWARQNAAETRRQEQRARAWAKESKKQISLERTAEAQKALDAIGSLLTGSLETDHGIDWSTLSEHSPFPVPEPIEPSPQELPAEPKFDDPRFRLKINWFLRLVPQIRQKADAKSKRAFSEAREEWLRAKARCELDNRARHDQFNSQHESWRASKSQWLDDQVKRNTAVEKARADYLAYDPNSISEYCEMVLHNSQYPDSFPCDAGVQYLPESRTIVVDYSLPDLTALPTLKEVKYVAARDAFQDVFVSDSWLSRTYDSVLYQIALRSIYELFQSDAINALEFVVFNGWVTSTDKATGKNATGCVLSIQAQKAEFMDINLDQVDPKACFKKLKGVSATRLTALQPVRPILQLNREDKRFVSAYEVADALEDSSNLAAMDWEDFEQLIREIFEKEFSKNGGEVKITQASRDGGVDAVAFDPDPLRGGKIIIQAKRYTHTVSVSAVRDLYGTIHNEGANKGILVTTADYGPDAYEFAKGKPITLLSGNELLYLLQKHGHKARIDLQEARLLNSEKEKAQGSGSP